jgi:F-type H+-transporting ATPase subunit delta
VFHGERWAVAFINTLGENAEAGLACLRAITPPVKEIRGALFGRNAAVKIEQMLREAAGNAAGAAPEYAIRFITLLVEKKCFKYIDTILQKIEERLDERKGILNVIAESAVPLDGDVEEALRLEIKERTGAAEVKMRTCVSPELLGGYRLRIGSLRIDASLKGQLEQMAADLAAPFAPASGE